MKTTLTNRYLLWLPALVAVLLYLPTLRGGFVWDDTIFLVDVPLYRNPANWGAALTKPFLLSPNYYRPAAVLTFLLELRLFGLSPWVFHLTNIALHALNTALVTSLAVRLITPEEKSPGLAALAAGLFYAVHPALVEGVAFISSRFDLLMTALLLATLLMEWRQEKWRAVGVLILGAALATLSKEMAVGLLAVYPLWWWASRANLDRRAHLADLLRRWCGVAVGIALALIVRWMMVGVLFRPEAGHPIEVGSPLAHALLVARSFVEYVLMSVWPFTTLTPIHYTDLPLRVGDPAVWLAFIAAIVIASALAMTIRRARPSAWLIAASVAALGPVLNIIPLELDGGAFIAERFLTFPLAFLALALGAFLVSSVEIPTVQLRVPVLAVWLVAAAATVQLNVPHWRSDQTLWQWAIEQAPLSPVPYTNLALEAVETGRYEQGLDLAEQALALDPDSLNAANNKGLALFHKGAYTEAQAVFADLVQRAPQELLYWNNLAGALREQGRLQEAERILLDQVLALDPAFPAAHLNLGIVYLRADRPDLAANHLNEAARLLPPAEAAEAGALLAQTQDPVRWLRLADLFLANNEPQRALAALDQAEQLGASPEDVGVGRSAGLISLGELDMAESLLIQMLEAGVEDARVYNNLGLIARERGVVESARSYFERASELAPDWQIPLQNLEGLEDLE